MAVSRGVQAADPTHGWLHLVTSRDCTASCSFFGLSAADVLFGTNALSLSAVDVLFGNKALSSQCS